MITDELVEAPKYAPDSSSGLPRPLQRVTLQGAIRAILLLAFALRFALGVMNLEANDDHMEVSRVIAFENRFPADEELYQAYHPKLYHTTVALIWRVLPDPTLENATRAAQLVNVAAGMLTLLLVLALLRRIGWPPVVLLASFAFVAFNPRLIAISGQAANDSFAILFGTLALTCGYAFFRNFGLRAFAGMTAGTILMALSKANGLILLVAMLVTFGAATIHAPRLAAVARTRVLLCGVAFLMAFFATVPWLAPYGRNVRDHGTPFVSNHDIAPFPFFLKETAYGRPGAKSIVGGVMTFRFIDLLRHPMNTQSQTDYPAHRTSYWSQLYGRTQFAHFEYHPPSWRTDNPVVLWLGRAIFMLALWPVALLLFGLVRQVLRTAAAWLRPTRDPRALSDGLLAVAAFGLLAAGALYALRQRTFASMNAIYVLPAVPAFAIFFADGFRTMLERLRSTRALQAFAAISMLLIGCYVLDVLIVLYHLR